MKLDRKILKKLIVETLQEAEVPKDAYVDDPERDWSTDRTYEPPSGPLPEESMSLDDIADYFHKVGEEMQQRIDQLKSIPSAEFKRMPPEEVTAGIEEMKQVQQELADISKDLEALLASIQK